MISNKNKIILFLLLLLSAGWQLTAQVSTLPDTVAPLINYYIIIPDISEQEDNIKPMRINSWSNAIEQRNSTLLLPYVSINFTYNQFVNPIKRAMGENTMFDEVIISQQYTDAEGIDHYVSQTVFKNVHFSNFSVSGGQQALPQIALSFAYCTVTNIYYGMEGDLTKPENTSTIKKNKQ